VAAAALPGKPAGSPSPANLVLGAAVVVVDSQPLSGLLRSAQLAIGVVQNGVAATGRRRIHLHAGAGLHRQDLRQQYTHAAAGVTHSFDQRRGFSAKAGL
jgi:hypothetical protein